MPATSKAFGKILVFGAYSILEPGNVGWVVNVDKGTTTSVEETHSGRVILDLKNFEIEVYGSVQEGKLKLEKNPEIIKYIKNAVEYSYTYLNKRGIRVKDIKLMSMNDPEISVSKKKAGFGSSATSTVSTVAAILSMHDIDDRDLVYRISRFSHFISQGSGSGFDVLSSVYGSCLFISDIFHEYDFFKYLESKNDTAKQEFEWPNSLLPMLIFTGRSASTKKLVAQVMEFKKGNKNQYNQFMERYNQVNLDLKNALEIVDLPRIKMGLERSWYMRKHLGKLSGADIEPDKFTRLLNEIKQNGAYTAGLVGAGGGDSILAVCTSPYDKKELREYCKHKRLNVLDVQLCSTGYIFE